LRRPIESAQYTSFDYSQTLDDHGVLASIGTVGDAYDCEHNPGRWSVSV
jgi:putative transposase